MNVRLASTNDFRLAAKREWSSLGPVTVIIQGDAQ